jgi:flagellar biosynthesis protein FlhF
VLDSFRNELAELRLQLERRNSLADTGTFPDARPRSIDARAEGWRVGALLEAAGLLPVHAGRVVEQLAAAHGSPPEALRDEIDLTRRLLRDLWTAAKPAVVPESNLHVLVGAAGAGKTTCLCKWLAKAVLVENRAAQVWRLDGRVANTAESLSVYCEILDVPVERSWPGEPVQPGPALGFVDLPGVKWRSGPEMAELREQLQAFPEAQIHLVLNAAYEAPLLMDQLHTFAALPLTDLIVAHLDEETRWSKLWNLILGTNFSVRFFSAGQNIPGEFQEATADSLLARQFSRTQGVAAAV